MEPWADDLVREGGEQLVAKVQFLVDYMDGLGMLPDHCFTFPDGETVHATKTLEEDNARRDARRVL